jgi:hypothetical protein
MLDRIALLMPRAASRGQQAGETTARQALRELSMGADIAALQQQRAGLASENVSRLFGRLDRMLCAELAGTCIDHAPLLSQIDRLLLQAVRADAALPGTSALVGLRRNLFPTAPAALQP